MKVLLVEDNPLTAKGLQYLLEREQYSSDIAPDFTTAQDLIRTRHYDLILLDVSLPDGDGFELAHLARQASPRTPIIFLTAKDDEDDVVRGLELGAEDYISKPFRNRELLLRIRKAMHRQVSSDHQLSSGRIMLNLDTHEVKVDQQNIILSPLERKLLICLLENPNIVVTRERLLDEIWDASGSAVNDNTLTVYMKRLRTKLGLPGAIVTVKNLGYRLCSEE